MEQIYYTQCPIGYGLGASNGFQIKRLSPGYPLSADVRHLGFRAFLAGTRTMAPAALRYRRGEDGTAEIAWLSPRSHEYETERGFWGRPGGHFAHGLRLDAHEFEAIGEWPAGLFDRPFWTRSDREPSRGEPPLPLGLSAADLRSPPTFRAIAPLAGLEDVRRLARLLMALAAAAREGRTLFLIDEPGQLADRVALLTFAFPEPWRRDLTFSTYHDRPEELVGFRIQGTSAAARPNRPVLLAQGMIADLVSGTFEPRIEPARWASTLAGWLVNQSPEDEAAWEATRRRALVAHAPEPPESIWSDSWLDRIVGSHALLEETNSTPSDAQGWSDLADFTAVARISGLAGEWVKARGPRWWRLAATTEVEARRAFVTHVGLAEAWSEAGQVGDWGEAVAAWARTCEPAERRAMITAALGVAPETARPVFIRRLIKALPAAISLETVQWLKSLSICDRAILLPLEVRGAVEAAVSGPGSRELRELLVRAIATPRILPVVLDALAAEADERSRARPRLAQVLAVTLEAADSSGSAALLGWALGRHDAEEWLRIYLRRAFSLPANQEVWRGILQRVAIEQRADLARISLEVARDPTLPDDSFRWCIEELLLPLAAAQRPVDPSWPGLFLDRTPSGLALMKRLFTAKYHKIGVRSWLEEARGRGELSRQQEIRIEECEAFVKALNSEEAHSLLNLKLPVVPAEDRGTLLGRILDMRGTSSAEVLPQALDLCREAWPGGFDAGAPGLREIAQALIEPLVPFRYDPRAWFDRLLEVLDHLKVRGNSGQGLEPDSLAAEIVAATVRRPGPDEFSPWPLRKFLLHDDAAWKLLAVDASRELRGHDIKSGLDRLKQWDQNLDQGPHTARFFEVWLNACDGPLLAAVVSARADDLRSLRDLPWWAARSEPDAARVLSLRDAFARFAPMAPLSEDALPSVQNWLRSTRSAATATLSDLVSLDEGADASRRGGVTVSGLSSFGQIRWSCVETLTKFYRAGIPTEACWNDLFDSLPSLRLNELCDEDRYRFLAWIIRRLDVHESTLVARLAMRLVEKDLSDIDRISVWAEELARIDPVPDDLRIARVALVSDLRAELKVLNRESEERTRNRRVSGSA